MRKNSPDFFCNERHERVQELQEILKNLCENCSCDLLVLFIITVESALNHLDVPVAVNIPDELIYSLSGKAKLKFVEHFGDVLSTFVCHVKYPLVLVLEF